MHRSLGVHISFVRSTNLDTWTSEQLKLMSFGGNGRAQVFFKQHGWTDGGEIESKYTSRAAELYRQLLVKEVTKSAQSMVTSSNALPDSPTALASPIVKDFVEYKYANETSEDTIVERPKTPPSVPSRPLVNSAKKPTAFGTKRNVGGKSGGLGAKKLISKGSSSISSAQFFDRDEGNTNASALDLTASELLSRLSMQASQDVSSLKSIAGETGRKLTSVASSLIADLQDRIR